MVARTLAGAFEGILFLGKKINFGNWGVNRSELIGSRCRRSAFSYALHSSADFLWSVAILQTQAGLLMGVPPSLQKHWSGSKHFCWFVKPGKLLQPRCYSPTGLKRAHLAHPGVSNDTVTNWAVFPEKGCVLLSIGSLLCCCFIITPLLITTWYRDVWSALMYDSSAGTLAGISPDNPEGAGLNQAELGLALPSNFWGVLGSFLT